MTGRLKHKVWLPASRMRIGYTFTALALSALSCMPLRREQPEVLREPNIIFIMADDLGYGDLGCYGQQKIRTPHLDKMAEQGMRFTQAYSGAPVCAPARSVLMTGLHMGHTPIRGNRSLVDRSRVPLPDSVTTLAEALQQAGYVTGMFGKWGLGEPGTEGHPNRQGFDEFYGFLDQARAHSYYPEYVWHNEDTVFFPVNKNGEQQRYVSDWYFQASLNFIKQNADTSFFCYLPLQLPHTRYQIPHIGKYDTTSWREDEKKYAAMVTRVDTYVGKILGTLDSLGIAENTLVFFTSDNGPAHPSPHATYTDDLDPAFFNSAGGFKGIKRDVYEGGIRVPMIVQWPGTVEKGSESDYPWAFHDLFPTLTELTGYKATVKTDGQSILRVLNGQPPPPRDYLYWEFFGEWEKEGLFLQALRKDNWKLVTGYTEAPELYDLTADPYETRDLCEEKPAKCKELKALMVNARIESRHWDVP